MTKENTKIWENSSFTERGLEIAEAFKDTYGREIRLQTSSAACYDAIWLGLAGDFYTIDGKYISASMHLDRPTTAMLIKKLQAWLKSTDCDETTDFTDDWNKKR